VQTAAGELEAALRARASPERIAPVLEELRTAVSDLVGRLRAALPAMDGHSAPAAASAPLDPARAREVVETMLERLGQYDPSASDCLEAHRPFFRSLLAGDAFAAFEARVAGFDFAEARDRLERTARASGLVP
jgi:hypothetical protein